MLVATNFSCIIIGYIIYEEKFTLQFAIFDMYFHKQWYQKKFQVIDRKDLVEARDMIGLKIHPILV